LPPLILQPILKIPLIQPGDDLAGILSASLRASGLELLDGDIIVVAQKIVSKAEGRLVNLTAVQPSPEALRLADVTGKDARLVELILRESSEVLRARENTLIVQHRLGFVCANAGIDHSNVQGLWGDAEDWVLLLPEAPDQSALRIRLALEAESGKQLGVLIIDSHGRAWRVGTVGACIGLAGMPALVDLRGQQDLFGYHLRVTMVAAADELAAAASLVIGQANEGTPAVLARGFPYALREGEFAELMRPADQDLFR